MPRLVRVHPAEVEILALALRRGADAAEGTRAHVSGCATCARREAEMKDLASAVRLEDTLAGELAGDVSEPPSERALAGRSRLAALAGEAESALGEADAFLELARDGNADLGETVRRLASTGAGRTALLYAAQRGSFAAALPQRALAVAEEIAAAADAPAPAAESGMRAVPPALLRAESRLLASQALLNIGRLGEARQAAVAARTDFATLGKDPFSDALCDYFEASVLCFQGAFPRAERLLRAAARVFADFGQDHWVGRAEAMRGVMLLQRGNHARALGSFDMAVAHFDPERDANVFAVTLLSRARCLGMSSRFEEARQVFAQALQVARRHGFDALVFAVRQGLAELEMLRGDIEKALASYRAVALEADRLGLEEDQVVTRLAAAECLGRLGRTEEMIDGLREIGRLVAVTDLAGNPAWTELAARLDPGDVDVGVVSEVRRHLESARDGFVLAFRTARRA